MFQYAMARALALRCHADLSLDTRWYRSAGQSPPRTFLLDRFQLADGLAEAAKYPPMPKLDKGDCKRYGIDADLRHDAGAKYPYPDPRRVALWLRRRRASYCIEQRNIFNFSAFLQPADAYIIGYWHNLRYFEDAQDVIRDELTPRNPPNAENRLWLARIAAADCAVAAHVRRGDYIGSSIHDVLSIDYYRQAIQLIEQRAGARATLFAFSDDPSWVEDNLRLDREIHVVRHNDAETGAPEDLRLMSACDHFAIANSTLSFWGAYLGAAPGKIMVAPSPWSAHRCRTWWIGEQRRYARQPSVVVCE